MSRPTSTAGRRKAAAPAEPSLSHRRRPQQMAPQAWQQALRRQFGRAQTFEWHNVGSDPVCSDFSVHNPLSGRHYRVTVRGPAPGDNRCTCPDFTTNALGTCKHIEFVLARLQARRGGKAALARGAQTPFSELWLAHGAAHRLRWRAGTACPGALAERAGRLFAAEGAAPPSPAEIESFTAAARLAGHELRVHDDVLAYLARARDDERRRRLLADAYPRGAADPALRKLVKARLYPYQAEGALFAARAGRALLADEMGLGKTVQAIAAAELLARHVGVTRVLVVCPTSLKHQWQQELLRFAGREALVLRGLRPARTLQWRAEAYCKITNYDTLARDADAIADWGPELIVVDEAQRVKNWNTVAARVIKRLADPAACPYAIVLTGTPLENRLEELISIVQIVDQHRLGPTWRLLHDHQQLDESGRVIGYRDLDRLGQTLAPILLRRRKAEVLTQLPERIDKTYHVPLTPQQREHHDENGAIVSRIVKRWRQTGFLSDSDQRRLQCALQNMRMACNSTWLLDRETDHGHKADELMTLLAELFEQPEAKAVVFSQWLGTHEVLMPRLQARGWGHVLFHGGVPGDRRGELVERFHRDPQCRVFLATDAGGVGLNLQHAAATVVIMDQPWNPAVLEQRIGRVYRMGQQRGVRVLHLVAQASIEEGMRSVLAFKKSLAAGVLDGGDADVFLEGTRLSQFMRTVDDVTGAVGSADEAAEAGSGVDDGPAGVEDTPAGVEAAPAGVDKATPAEVAATGPAPAPAADTAPAAAADPWAPLVDAGVALLRSLAAPDAAGLPGRVRTDPATGRRTLELPLPEPAAVQRLAEGLTALLQSLRR